MFWVLEKAGTGNDVRNPVGHRAFLGRAPAKTPGNEKYFFLLREEPKRTSRISSKILLLGQVVLFALVLQKGYRVKHFFFWQKDALNRIKKCGFAFVRMFVRWLASVSRFLPLFIPGFPLCVCYVSCWNRQFSLLDGTLSTISFFFRFDTDGIVWLVSGREVNLFFFLES